MTRTAAAIWSVTLLCVALGWVALTLVAGLVFAAGDAGPQRSTGSFEDSLGVAALLCGVGCAGALAGLAVLAGAHATGRSDGARLVRARQLARWFAWCFAGQLACVCFGLMA